MKALKLTLTIIAIIIILVLIIPVFLPNNVEVSGSKCMKATKETVFNQVNILKNWQNWSPFTTDSTMKIMYSVNDTGVGAQYHWSGKKVGKGSLKIIKSEPYNYIKTELDFGPQGTSGGKWNFDVKGDSTCVTWTIDIYKLQYPFGRWLGLMMKSGMKPVIDKALTKMKNFVENDNLPENNDEKLDKQE